MPRSQARRLLNPLILEIANTAILVAYAQDGLTYAASVGVKGAELAAGAIEHAAPIACK